MHRLTTLLILGLALLLAACASGENAAESEAPSDGSVRTVAVTLSDDMAIDIAESNFAVGETVRFEVTNEGTIQHEFYLGDEEAQDHHADEMAEMDGMSHDDPNGVSVAPGATETIEHTFEAAGELLAGCHEPGHYEAGMVATMSVSE